MVITYLLVTVTYLVVLVVSGLGSNIFSEMKFDKLSYFIMFSHNPSQMGISL